MVLCLFPTPKNIFYYHPKIILYDVILFKSSTRKTKFRSNLNGCPRGGSSDDLGGSFCSSYYYVSKWNPPKLFLGMCVVWWILRHAKIQFVLLWILALVKLFASKKPRCPLSLARLNNYVDLPTAGASGEILVAWRRGLGLANATMLNSHCVSVQFHLSNKQL